MGSGVDAEVLAQLLAFVEQTTDVVGVSDPWGRILYLNPAARKRLGIGEASDLTLADLFPPEAFGFYYDVVRPQLLRTGTWSGEVLVNAADLGAHPMYVSTTVKLGPGGETKGGVVYAHDTGRVDPAAVTNVTGVDEATGLPGPAAFRDLVNAAITTAHRDGEECALVLAEFLDMRPLIETAGVITAASLTRALAGRLALVARTSDIVGCPGEYQLGLLLRGVRSHREASYTARIVYESLVDPPVPTPGGEVVVSVACGVAVSSPGDGARELIQQAWAAMSHETLDREVDLHAPHAIADRPEVSVTMDDFRVALSHGHVRVYAQPVAQLATGARVGYQASARWHHHTLGVLDASAFSDMIAETPLANQVDLYIARETAAVLVLERGDAKLDLYTPVSKRLLADIRTEQYLSEIADAFFLSMHQIHLQVARPLLEHWSRSMQAALRSLRDAGVAVSLTDVDQIADARHAAEYGFTDLHVSPRLTAAAAAEPDTRRVLSEIARLAHDRGLEVVATGVDHRRQREPLVEAGCDLATGNVFGRLELADTVD